MSRITYFQNAYSESEIDVDISQMLQAIKSDKYKSHVEEIRKTTDPETKRKKKALLPCFTVSGTFTGKKSNDLKEHSGFIAMDFDNIDDLDDARAQLYGDDYTYAGFVSVGGAGLCIIVKIDGSKHADAFDALEKYYFTKYGYACDTAPKNVNRLRYTSYDPDLYFNPESDKFTQYLQKKKGRKAKIKPVIAGQNDFDYVLSQIQESKIDLTTDYATWIEIGMAIKSEYGDAGLEYFKVISQYYPEYSEIKTERKYNSFSSTGGTTIATFYHHAKIAGIDIKTPETKQATRVATFAKKGRRDKNSAIQQLQELDGIDSSISKPLVEQVFSSAGLPQIDDEDEIESISEYLRRECKIRYNQVTLKYEIDGAPMVDRDYNSIFLQVKSIFPKVSKEMVVTIIDSDKTTVYNPVKEFFTNYANKYKPGQIEKLADCIITRTGNKEYVRKFITKWMVGSVAMWHKYHSPLMLILAGTAQNTGKTHFFRYLLPNELQPYYAEAELNGDKDENLMMCNKLIIMNDEMSNKSRRDITVLKKLCSTKWFNLRRPYGRSNEDFRRIAALAGTSNDLALINDPTGNRRLIPFEVMSIDHALYNSIDKISLWVEAYHLFKNGEKFELTNEDISQLSEQTSEFLEASAEEEGLIAFFSPAIEGCQWLTNTQIKSYIEIRTKQRLSSKKLGMELIKLGYQREKKKVNGQVVSAYGVVESSGVVVHRFLEDEAPF